MHTVHSDGNWTIAELFSAARNTGLDFIAITDHNTASHHEEIDRLSKGSHEPFVLRGEEITTYGGHMNAWGLPSGTWIDFRTHPGDTNRIAEIAGEAHRAGALISINHPFVLCGGCAWSYDQAARDFDAIEVWNGPWDFTDEPAVKMWDKILQSGRRITAIASTDSHRPDTPIGKPEIHVAAKGLSRTGLLKAIREAHRGNAYFSPAIAKKLRDHCREALAGGQPSRKRTDYLTAREAEVLQLIAEGRANKQIAAELCISIKTVEKHRQQVMNKLGIHDVAGLTRHAIAKGIIETTSGLPATV
jgi:DNA-binding NarL/FixJ family response regulator